MNHPPLSLWIGRTAHVRHVPFKRAFHHRIAMIDIDVDRLEGAGAMSRFFSVGRFNLMSFHPEDNGPRNGSNLRTWANRKFAEAGLDLGNGSVRLATFPRVCGYAFAPLSVWYGYDAEGHLAGLIYEVHNTFGDAHSYVALVGDDKADQRRLHSSAPKEFYVSPFWDVSGDYRFTLNKPDKKLTLVVENMSDDQRLHTASLLAHRKTASSANIIRHFGARPFSAIGVTVAIHWQALQLLWRGAGYRSRPTQVVTQTTRAEQIIANSARSELTQGGGAAE